MTTESPSATALWLRHARDQLGVSRHSLAIAAGISPGTLRNAETSRHRISRDTAMRLMQEIVKRDAILAHTAPSPLLEAALHPRQWADRASRLDSTEPPPLAHLRFQPIGPRALLQLELDPHALRQLVRDIENLLARSQHSPSAGLPGLHLVLVKKK